MLLCKKLIHKTMKPIFILAIAAIAATGIGAAQLGTDINVTVNSGFGQGGANIESPISDADVSFIIEAIPTCDLVDAVGASVDCDPNENRAFKNLVTDCVVHTDDFLDTDAIVICKLSDDMNGDNGDAANIVAEGRITVGDQYPQGYEGSEPINVPVQAAFPGANSVFNIQDVHIVVIGENVDEEPPQEP